MTMTLDTKYDINRNLFQAYHNNPVPIDFCQSIVSAVNSLEDHQRNLWLEWVGDWITKNEHTEWAEEVGNRLLSIFEDEDAQLPPPDPAVVNQLSLTPTMAELIQIYMDRFINRTDIWAKQWIKYEEGDEGERIAVEARYASQEPNMNTFFGRYPYEPVTPGLILRMFDGKVSCAWPAVDQNGDCRWLCFDSDEDNGDMDKLEKHLLQWRLSVVREGRRPGRAGHLWLFFDQPVPAEKLMILGDALMKLAGIAPMERFPKGEGINQVRGPFSINLKPEAEGVRGWFDGCPERDFRKQLEWFAEQSLNSSEDAIREADKWAHIFPTNNRAPARKLSFVPDSTDFDIREYVHFTPDGKNLQGRCPLCAAEGGDRHRDNLKASADGSKFTCVNGGPGEVHQAKAIKDYLLQQAQSGSNKNGRR